MLVSKTVGATTGTARAAKGSVYSAEICCWWFTSLYSFCDQSQYNCGGYNPNFCWLTSFCLEL